VYRCVSPGAIGINLSWEACLPLARDSRFEGIDVPLEEGIPGERYREGLSKFHLKPGGTGFPVRVSEDRTAFEAQISKLPAIAARAQAAGVTRFATWILSWSDTLPYRENFKLHAAQLGQAARILQDHGCRLALEFLGPRSLREGHRYTFAHTIEQMLELGDAVGKNVGLLLDAYHWYTSVSTLDQLLELENRQVVYVHINDAPGVPVEKQQDQVRRIAGEGVAIDLPGFLSALRKIGYDGPVVPEPFVPELAQMPPDKAMARVAEGLKRVWDAPAR